MVNIVHINWIHWKMDLLHVSTWMNFKIWISVRSVGDFMRLTIATSSATRSQTHPVNIQASCWQSVANRVLSVSMSFRPRKDVNTKFIAFRRLQRISLEAQWKLDGNLMEADWSLNFFKEKFAYLQVFGQKAQIFQIKSLAERVSRQTVTHRNSMRF